MSAETRESTTPAEWAERARLLRVRCGGVREIRTGIPVSPDSKSPPLGELTELDIEMLEAFGF